MSELAETEAIDPVCKMRVKKASAAAKWTFEQQDYFFCNPGCKTKFEKAPHNYLAQETKAKQPHFDHKTFYLPDSALEYVCPMHPEQRSKTPSSCAICGMDLEASLAADNSDKSKEEIDFQRRFLIATVFTALLLAIAMPSMLGLGLKIIPEDFLPYAELILAIPVVLWCGAPIYSRAYESAKQKHTNMFSLISIGVWISFLSSLAYIFNPQRAGHMHEGLYFESAATTVTLVLLGQILELKARKKSSQSLQQLFSLAPRQARRLSADNNSEEITVDMIQKNDRLQIIAGDQIPADGLVITGKSNVDESLISGNNLPVLKQSGDRVFAGSLNLDGTLLIKSESAGAATVFAQIIAMLLSAQRSRSNLQTLADRISSVFIPLVFLIAGLTFTLWLNSGSLEAWHHAIQNTVAVLVIACPCALGLATPIAVSTAVSRAAKLGIMVKDAGALEALAEVQDFLIDKTGTLSEGRFRLLWHKSKNEDTTESLRLAASLEKESKHPLAFAICAAAKELNLEIAAASDLKTIPGSGLSGSAEGKQLALGNARFMKELGISPGEIDDLTSGAPEQGSFVYLAVDQKLDSLFCFEDSLRAGAAQFISELRALSLKPWILSGDSKSSILSTGKALSIPSENLLAELLPQNKVEQIKKLQEQKHLVAMLGDGVNDVAALATADAGLAMASGSDIAISSAPVTISNPDLSTVTASVKLARFMKKTMKENLFLAFAYNVVALSFASGAFYPSLGIELNPSMAAAAMSLSSLSVIFNSLRINSAKF
ncbi:MAG: cadmium-translocating P-type ATPase [Candidatus Obscuribacterales bacterium]|nr:cadmium-translocating P-type ATPase [Candidatus Obscuribacterales bacterium]